jgi:hypothetical protein
MERVFLGNSPVAQLIKNFPIQWGTRRFIILLTRARHWSLSWARRIQSIWSHRTSLKPILFLSAYLRLGSFSGLFASGFPIKTLYTSIFSYACYMLYQFHNPWLVFKILSGEVYQLWNSSSSCPLQLCVKSSPFSRNVTLSTLFSSVYVLPLM